jgi:aminoglycoside 6'-N-acetyltransferase
VELTTLRDGELKLRPVAEGDLDRLVEIVSAPGVGEWWGFVESEEKLRDDLLSDGDAYAIEVDGKLAGWLGVWEEDEPEFRHGGVDIMLAPDRQGRGIGPRALRMAIDWLIDECGHHRVTIDPAVGNDRAIHAYQAVGFHPVGVMRKYSKGPDGKWRDGLLMDLLAEELRE